MPFVYRAIDAGIASIDTTTLVEAARNLGAGWATVLCGCSIPCLRTAIVNARFLCFALVMGEFTIANDPALQPSRSRSGWCSCRTASGQVQAADVVASAC